MGASRGTERGRRVIFGPVLAVRKKRWPKIDSRPHVRRAPPRSAVRSSTAREPAARREPRPSANGVGTVFRPGLFRWKMQGPKNSRRPLTLLPFLHRRQELRAELAGAPGGTADLPGRITGDGRVDVGEDKVF